MKDGTHSHLAVLFMVEGKEEYHVEISNRFTALENSDTDVDINRAWELLDNIKTSAKESIGYYESKRHKP
jgi:hypothetical protein